MPDPKHIAAMLLRQFPYQPTVGQLHFIDKLSAFLNTRQERPVFVLKGYAGTGKTTLVSSLVKILPYINMQSVLLAPTGRAAKVLSSYSGKTAHTIHRKIYFCVTSAEGQIKMTLMPNPHKNTVFIVDEASMVPDGPSATDTFRGPNLLEDLINYVFSAENNFLLFIGDQAQLPPVGISQSPALDLNYLKNSFSLAIDSIELQEVVRQAKESGILSNATRIREKIQMEKVELPLFHTTGFPDVIRLNGSDLEEVLNEFYSRGGSEDSVVVTRSNKRANMFNDGIRARILFRENELEAGDHLMVVKNNYFWLGKESKAGFIANGDVLEVLTVKRRFEIYGFQFASVTIRLVDYPEEKDMEVLLLLDTLHSLTPSLSQADNNRLFNEVLQDFTDIPNKRARLDKVKNSEHFNALQVKFSYALTCHKTQGGQWENVIVDQGYVTDEMMDNDYLRWMYTAVTRATKKLYLLNFDAKYYEES
jgi:exodeoxyribonuclease-5